MIRRILRSVAVWILAALFIEVAAYAALRVYYLHLTHRPELWNHEIKNVIHRTFLPGHAYFRYDPILTYRWGSGSEIYEKKINRYGFIQNSNQNSYTPMKPKGSFRIFVMGDSAVAGADLYNYHTIARELEDRLHAMGDTNVQIINAAVLGYNSFQQLTYFANDIIYNEPDMVIFIGGPVDLYWSRAQMADGSPYPRNWTQYSEGVVQAFGQSQSLSGNLRLFSTNLWLRLRYSYTTLASRKINYLVERKWGFQPIPLEKLLDVITPSPSRTKTGPSGIPNPDAIQTTINNVRSLIGTAQAHRVKIIATLQPTAKNEFDGLSRVWAKLAGDYSDVPGVQILDLSKLFKEVTEPMTVNAVHYNQAGTTKIAAELAPLVHKAIN